MYSDFNFYQILKWTNQNFYCNILDFGWFQYLDQKFFNGDPFLVITMYLYSTETVWIPGVIKKIQYAKAIGFKPYSMIIMIAGGVR